VKLAGGDMLVVDAQYQTKCLVTLYKCAELSRNDQEDSSEKVLYGILFLSLNKHTQKLTVNKALANLTTNEKRFQSISEL